MANINLRIDLKMKSYIQLARKNIVDNIEEEIEKTDNEEFKEALIEKLTEVLKSDLILIQSKPQYNTQKIPMEPVNVKGTPLKLKNMSNNIIYKNFCTSIADIMGYSFDFSNSPFSHLPKNARVYEAIRKLYISGKIDQTGLDELVEINEKK